MWSPEDGVGLEVYSLGLGLGLELYGVVLSVSGLSLLAWPT